MQKYERHLSAFAMLAGFVVDSLFFGRIDLWQTHVVFASYTVICFITIPLLHLIETRAAQGIERPRWRSILPIMTQFALGGFWSGFLIFYVRSAAITTSWPFLILLLAVLIGNEFLRRYHERLVFTSVLFFFALYSYAIFAVPVYTHSIGTLTFLVSGVVAIIVFSLFTAMLRILGSARFRADVWRIRAGALVVLIVINLFYFTNILPPLPLSAKAAGIYHGVWRTPSTTSDVALGVRGNYLATAEAQPWKVNYLGFKPTLHVVPNESLYAYSSIFAPTKLETTIVHRWQWYDPETKKWVTRASVAYPIVGGRDGGYRGYSAVFMSVSGEWRVNIETADGRLLERLSFTVKQVALPPASETIKLK